MIRQRLILLVMHAHVLSVDARARFSLAPLLRSIAVAELLRCISVMRSGFDHGRYALLIVSVVSELLLVKVLILVFVLFFFLLAEANLGKA